MPEAVPARLRHLAVTCFPDQGSRNSNNLVLIHFCLVRAGASRRKLGGPEGAAERHSNPKRRVLGLVARLLGARGLADLLDRKPHLLRARRAILAAAARCH